MQPSECAHLWALVGKFGVWRAGYGPYTFAQLVGRGRVWRAGFCHTFAHCLSYHLYSLPAVTASPAQCQLPLSDDAADTVGTQQVLDDLVITKWLTIYQCPQEDKMLHYETITLPFKSPSLKISYFSSLISINHPPCFVTIFYLDLLTLERVQQPKLRPY